MCAARKNGIYANPAWPGAAVASAFIVFLVRIPPITVNGVVVGPWLSAAWHAVHAARLVGSAEFFSRPRTALLLHRSTCTFTCTVVADRQRLLFPIAGFSSVPVRLLLVRRKQQLNLVDRRRRPVVQFHGQWFVGVVRFFRHVFDRHSPTIYDVGIRQYYTRMWCAYGVRIPTESFLSVQTDVVRVYCRRTEHWCDENKRRDINRFA